MPRRILAFAKAAGGAAALVSVLQELQRQDRILLLAAHPATDVFRRAGLEPMLFPAFSEMTLAQQIAGCFGGEPPDVVLTSATSLPQLDMTEKYVWRWAHACQIPSVAVLDQWQNYALRFSGPGLHEHLAYLPDWIAAMDGHAKQGMIDAGIPAERIVVTGQPAFDRLAQMRQSFSPEERQRLRQALGVLPQAKLICFIAESFADVFGERLGFTEQSVLHDLLGICAEMVSEAGQSLHLVVKLHPENEPGAFAWVNRYSRPEGLRVTVQGTEQPAIPLVMSSDVVIGMTSVLLVESILLGRPTVSFQPHARDADGLIATVLGAIPLLDNRQACAKTVRGLLTDPVFRSTYLQRQDILKADGHASSRLVGLVRRISAQAPMVGERR